MAGVLLGGVGQPSLSDELPPDDRFLAQLQAMITGRGYDWTAGPTGVSQFPPEQRRWLLGAIEEEPPPEIPALGTQTAGHPNAVDWRNVGGRNFTTPIRSQGGCGSCAAFGTVGAIDSRMEVAADNAGWNPDLSEAQVFFCSDSWTCGNGSAPSVLLDYARDTGVVDEGCFPYSDHDQPCNLCAGWPSRATQIDNWHWASGSDAIKDAVAQGPVEATFTVYTDFYYYTGGIYRYTWGNEEGGHAVVIVGYNDAGGYWICKNSWDTGWGESGYFRIAYGECGIDDWGYVPDVDLTPPTNPTVSSSSHTPGAWSQDDTVDVQWSGATDNYKVEGYSYTWSRSATTLPDTTMEGSGTNATSLALASADSWYFHVRTRDHIGNWTGGAAHYGPFYIDTTNPTGSISIASGVQYISDTAVALGLSAQDTSSGVAEMRFSNDGTGWSSWEEYVTTRNWTLLSGDGAKTVYVQFRDGAGNISSTYSDDIVLDTVPPTNGSITINGDADYATQTAVTLTLSAQDATSGVVQVRLSDDGINWGAWEGYATTHGWILSSGDGQKTAYIQFRDGAGNVTSTYSDAIILDTTPPGGSITINGGTPYATRTAVTLTLSAQDVGSGLDSMRFNDDGTNWSTWEVYTTSRDWILSGADGEKTIHAQFRDEAGNASAHSTTIVLDRAAPTSAVQELPTQSATPFTVYWLGMDATAGIATYDVQYRDGLAAAWTDWLLGTTDTSAGFTGEQEHTYYFRTRARDGAGNLEDWPVDPDGDAITTVRMFRVYLPLVLRDYVAFANGGFESSWTSWEHEGELAQAIVNDPAVAREGSGVALLGDAHYSNNGGVPVGSARIWQNFSVPANGNPTITLWYRIYTHDVVWVSETSTYYDSFEIYVNTVNWGEVNDPDPNDARRSARCRTGLGVPDASQTGLVFCDGKPTGATKDDPPADLSWRSVTLDLCAFRGQNVTLYLANFNRQDGYYNTWTYVDAIAVNW